MNNCLDFDDTIAITKHPSSIRSLNDLLLRVNCITILTEVKLNEKTDDKVRGKKLYRIKKDDFAYQRKFAKYFVIFASDQSSLRASLLHLKNIRLFNQHGRYAIQLSANCQQAHEFLNIAWECKILNVVVVCRDITTQIDQLYTFNPFVNDAPITWTKLRVASKQKNERPLVYLFQRNDVNNCNEVFFHQQITNLHGYPIKILKLV